MPTCWHVRYCRAAPVFYSAVVVYQEFQTVPSLCVNTRCGDLDSLISRWRLISYQPSWTEGLTEAWHVQVCTSLSSCQRDSSLPGRHSNAKCRKWQVSRVGGSPVYTTVNPIKLSCDTAAAGGCVLTAHTWPWLCALNNRVNLWDNLGDILAMFPPPNRNILHVTHMRNIIYPLQNISSLERNMCCGSRIFIVICFRPLRLFIICRMTWCWRFTSNMTTLAVHSGGSGGARQRRWSLSVMTKLGTEWFRPFRLEPQWVINIH